MSCDKQNLDKAILEEAYYTKRYKLALDRENTDGPFNESLPTSITVPEHLKTTDYDSKLRSSVNEKDDLITAMNDREQEVERCVNDLISYQNLENAQITTASGINQALDVAEQQKKDALTSYANMLSERDSKKRMVEINTYYSKQYDAYTNIFKIIFAFCIPLVILGMLNKEELLDDTSYFRFSLLIIVIAFFMTVSRISDMYWRNNINFDNYEWLYNTPPTMEDDKLKRSIIDSNQGIALGGNTATCSGSSCCSNGTYWNNTRCVILPSHGLSGDFNYTHNDPDGNTITTKVNLQPTGETSGTMHGIYIKGTYIININEDSGNYTIEFTPELKPGQVENDRETYSGNIGTDGSSKTIDWEDKPPIHKTTTDSNGNVNDVSSSQVWTSTQ